MKFIIFSALLVLGACSGQSTKKSDDSKGKAEPKKESTDSSKVSNPNFEFKSVESEVTCKSGGDARVITHGLLDGGGCAVNYTKFGEKSQVAKAKFNYNHCSNIFNKIKGALEEAGFACE
jgi:hypothetical protein